MEHSLDIIAADFQERIDDSDGDEKDDFDIVFSQDFEADTEYSAPTKKQRIDDLQNDLTDEDLEPNTVRPGDGRSLIDHDDEADNVQNNILEEVDAEGSLPPLESLGANISRLSPMESFTKGPGSHSFLPPMAGGSLGHSCFIQQNSFITVAQHGPALGQPPQQLSASEASPYFPPLPTTQPSFNDMKNTLMSGCPSFEGVGELSTGRNETGQPGGLVATDDQSDHELPKNHRQRNDQPIIDLSAPQNGDPMSSSVNVQEASAVGPFPIRPPYPTLASQTPPETPSAFAMGNIWGNPTFLPQFAPNFHLSMVHQRPIGVPSAPQEVLPHPSEGTAIIMPLPIPPSTTMPPAANRPLIRSLPTDSPETNKAKVVPVSSSYDAQELTEYQILIRQQFEFFEATLADVQASVQGRRKKLSVGQVGIRCKHCSHRPIHCRRKSSVYYPTYIKGVYQSAQNMAKNHLCDSCDSIPDALKERLRFLQKQGGLGKTGKGYWVEGCRFAGIVETASKKLRFKGSRIGSPIVEEANEG